MTPVVKDKQITKYIMIKKGVSDFLNEFNYKGMEMGVVGNIVFCLFIGWYAEWFTLLITFFCLSVYLHYAGYVFNCLGFLNSDDLPDSILFSFGIAEQCTKHDKILKFLMSRPSEVERSGLDVSLLSDLMGLQALKTDAYQQPFGPSLIYPSGQLHAPKPILDFVRDLASSSKIVVQPDGRVIFTDTGKEVNDLLSVVAEFYVSRNSSKCGQLSMLVPRYSRYGCLDLSWYNKNYNMYNIIFICSCMFKFCEGLSCSFNLLTPHPPLGIGYLT